MSQFSKDKNSSFTLAFVLFGTQSHTIPCFVVLKIVSLYQIDVSKLDHVTLSPSTTLSILSAPSLDNLNNNTIESVLTTTASSLASKAMPSSNIYYMRLGHPSSQLLFQLFKLNNIPVSHRDESCVDGKGK